MKKMLFSLAIIFLAVSIAFANGIDVPKKVKSTFKAKYPTAQNIIWDADEDNFLATFDLDSLEGEVFFDKKGEWVQTFFNLGKGDLPEAIIDYLDETYDSAELDSAIKIEQPSGTTYEVSIEVMSDDEDEDSEMVVITFDENGHPLED